MLTAIAAVSADWGIGRDGDLLFNIPEDKKHFRRTTINHKVIMGRKTLESLPNGKPFGDRKNIVLSRNKEFSPDGVTVCHSTEEVLSLLENQLLKNQLLKSTPDEKAFVAGGGEIYKAMLPYCQKAIITKISGAPPADTYFPNLDEDPEWTLAEESDEQEYEELKYRFCTYIKEK